MKLECEVCTWNSCALELVEVLAGMTGFVWLIFIGITGNIFDESGDCSIRFTLEPIFSLLLSPSSNGALLSSDCLPLLSPCGSLLKSPSVGRGLSYPLFCWLLFRLQCLVLPETIWKSHDNWFCGPSHLNCPVLQRISEPQFSFAWCPMPSWQSFCSELLLEYKCSSCILFCTLGFRGSCCDSPFY